MTPTTTGQDPLRRIVPYSDLHWDTKPYEEFEYFLNWTRQQENTLFINTGDFCNGVNTLYWKPYLEAIQQTSNKVLFVPGNHDFYGHTLPETWLLFHELGVKYSNFIPFIDGEELQRIDGVYCFGSTLWYHDTPDVYLLQNRIFDFSKIKDCTVSTFIKENGKVNNLFEKIDWEKMDSPVIWMFHHLPSVRSIEDKFATDRLNCYFVAPGTEIYIRKHQPDLVFHGHSHHTQQYKIGKTQVISNPGAYPKENPSFSFDRFQIFI